MSGLLLMATDPLCLHSGVDFFARYGFPLSGFGVFEVVMRFFWEHRICFHFIILFPLIYWFGFYYHIFLWEPDIYSLYFPVFLVINFIFTIKNYVVSLPKNIVDFVVSFVVGGAIHTRSMWNCGFKVKVDDAKIVNWVTRPIRSIRRSYRTCKIKER